MKRNYSYLQGGNLPQKKLPKLNDQEIEKIYKFYTSKDKFHKKFQGTKRDYCYKVAGIIENFYQKNNLNKINFDTFMKFGNKLKGGVKDVEYVKKFINITDGKIQKKITENIKKSNIYEIKEKFENFKYLEDFGVEDLTYDKLVDHAQKFDKFIDIVFKDEPKIGLDNFLLAAVYPSISVINRDGQSSRKAFSSNLNTSETATFPKHKGAVGKEWGDPQEAAYVTEYLYATKILKPMNFFKHDDGSDWTEEEIRFYCLQKIFSQQANFETVDFKSSKKIFELKGNKTIGEDLKGLQVDTKKVAEVILSSFATGTSEIRKTPLRAHISFFKYLSNGDISNISIDDSGNIVLSSSDRRGLPISGILDWDMTDMLNTTYGKAYLFKIKDELNEFSSEKSPKERTDIAKSIDELTYALIYEYFGRPGVSSVGTTKANATKDVSSLTLDLGKSEISSKLKVLGYANNLGLTENPTVEDYYEAISQDIKRPPATDLSVSSGILGTMETQEPIEIIPEDLEWNPFLRVEEMDYTSKLVELLKVTIPAVKNGKNITQDNLLEYLRSVKDNGPNLDPTSGKRENAKIIVGYMKEKGYGLRPVVPPPHDVPALAQQPVASRSKSVAPQRTGVDLLAFVRKKLGEKKSLALGNIQKIVGDTTITKENMLDSLSKFMDKQTTTVVAASDTKKADDSDTKQEDQGLTEEEKINAKDILKRIRGGEDIGRDGYVKLAEILGYPVDDDVGETDIKDTLVDDHDYLKLNEELDAEDSGKK